jgi:hypothetical protein
MQPFGGALNAIAIIKARIARSRFMRLLTAQLLPDSGLLANHERAITRLECRSIPLGVCCAKACRSVDHSQIQPSLTRPNIGDVTGPLLIWLVCHEVTVQQVGRNVELVIAVCRYPPTGRVFAECPRGMCLRPSCLMNNSALM